MSASRLFSSPEEQAVCAVSLANYGVFTEHQGGGPLLRTGEFARGENEIITNFIFHYNNHLKMTPTIQAWIMTPTMDWVKKLQKVRKNWHFLFTAKVSPFMYVKSCPSLSCWIDDSWHFSIFPADLQQKGQDRNNKAGRAGVSGELRGEPRGRITK